MPQPDPNPAVTEEASAPSTEVQETVTAPETAESTTAEETQSTPETTTETTQPVSTEVNEKGIPWKNVAMEAHRKLEEMPSVIKQTVEEALATKEKRQDKYTREHIPMLKQYARDNPQHADWVENQIESIRSDEVANTVRMEVSAIEKRATEQTTRQQTEQWVVSHPVFKECFMDNGFGQKVWNMSNPLTQIMGQVLNTVDPSTGRAVKDRPDGLAIAAEIAYGRYALNSLGKAGTTVNQLKKDLRKAQTKTMIPVGSLPPASAPQKSSVKKSLDNYNKTYSKRDIQDATKNFLLQSGVLKEE